MKLADIPSKIVLAFAADGARGVVPVDASLTPGRASYQEGYPPLTFTPIEAGGIPPNGLDINGVLYDSTGINRWSNAGGNFPFDDDFASDPNVGGYPAGAMLLQSDGNGLWLNQTDDQTLDPNNVDSAQFGWVPGVRYGVSSIDMSSSNYTLLPNEYASPIIVISGLLSTNVQLIFPAISCQWIVINNTAGAYTITCKTASGAGIQASGNRLLYSDGTDIKQAATDVVATSLDVCASAGGTADAITAIFPNLLPQSYTNGMPFYVRAASANTTTTPTVTFNSGTLSVKTIVKGSNQALAIGDIAGAGHWLMMQYDETLDKVVLLNPATWNTGNTAGVIGQTNGLVITATGSDSNLTVAFNECMVENSANQYVTARNLSLVKTTGAWSAGTAAGGLDTGSIAAFTWYYFYAIYNPSTAAKDILISLSATAPTMPSGYTYKALTGAAQTDVSSHFYGMTQKGKTIQYKLNYLLISGSYGSTTIPTWQAVSIATSLPSIATKVRIQLNNPTSGSGCMAAPNNGFGAIDDTGNQPPFIAANFPSTTVGDMVIESSNIYYASNGANSALRILGWSFGD